MVNKSLLAKIMVNDLRDRPLLHYVRTILLDMRHVKRYIHFWSFGLSEPTCSFTVFTFYPDANAFQFFDWCFQFLKSF